MLSGDGKEIKIITLSLGWDGKCLTPYDKIDTWKIKIWKPNQPTQCAKTSSHGAQFLKEPKRNAGGTRRT